MGITISRKKIFLLVVRTARRTGRMVPIWRKVSQERGCERKIGTIVVLENGRFAYKAAHQRED